MKITKKYLFCSLIVFALISKIFWSKYVIETENHEQNTIKLQNNNDTIYIPTIYRGDCKVMSIESLKEFSDKNNFTNGIPKVLHYVSNEEDISKVYTELYKNCGKLNSDMKLVLWTDASFYRVFITKFDKSIIEKWKVIFSNLNDPARTAMIRSMVLFTFGGVSLSLDTVCQQPIRNFIGQDICFASVGNTMKANIEFNRDDDFGESVLGCIAGFPFLKMIIENPRNYDIDRFYFTEYFQYYNNIPKMIEVTKLDSKIAEQILPKNEMANICTKGINGTKREPACTLLKSYKSQEKSTAMLVHQPIYGLSNIQIIADDICSAGIAVHIIIV